MESAKEPQTDRGGGRFFWLLIFVAFYQEKASADKMITGQVFIAAGKVLRSRLGINVINGRIWNCIRIIVCHGF